MADDIIIENTGPTGEPGPSGPSGPDEVIAQLRADVERLKKERDEALIRASSADNLVAGIEQENERLKADLATTQQSAAEMRDAQAAVIEQLQKNAADAAERSTAERKQREALESANSELKNANTKLAEKLEFATTHDLAVEKARAAKYKEGFDQQMKAHEAAMKSNAEMRESHKAELREKDEKIAILQARVQELEPTAESLDLKAQIEEAKKVRDELKAMTNG